MQVVSLAWGILALLGFAVGFIPCLGWMNWFNIPFSAIGLIVSLVAFNSVPPGQRSLSVIGIILCSIGVVIGAKRLIAGGGIL